MGKAATPYLSGKGGKKGRKGIKKKEKVEKAVTPPRDLAPK